MSVRSLVHLLYPPLLALHDLTPETALQDPTTGRLQLPDIMRDSHLYMEAHGVYLIGPSFLFTVRPLG
jgi:protein transport protein SEC24